MVLTHTLRIYLENENKTLFGSREIHTWRKRELLRRRKWRCAVLQLLGDGH